MTILLVGLAALLLEGLAHWIVPPFTRGRRHDFLIRYAIGTALWVGPVWVGTVVIGTYDGELAALRAGLVGAAVGTLAAYAIHAVQDRVMARR